MPQPLSFDELFTNLRVGSYNYGFKAQASFQLEHPALGMVFSRNDGDYHGIITYNPHARSFVYRNAKSSAKTVAQIKYEIMRIIKFENLSSRTIGSIVGPYWGESVDDSGRKYELDEVDRNEFIITLSRIIAFFRTPLGGLSFGEINNLKDATLTFIAANRSGLMSFHRYHSEVKSSNASSPPTSRRGRLSSSELQSMIDDQSTRLRNIERVAQHEINQVSMKLGVVMSDNSELRDIVEQQSKVIEDMKRLIIQQHADMKQHKKQNASRFQKIYNHINGQSDKLNALLDGLRLTIAVTNKTA